MKINIKITLLIFIFMMTTAEAVVISEDKIETLASKPTWLKLLHYKDEKSSIIDNNFFLADNGNVSPIQELKETLKAYNLPFTKANEHPQCRYPARYYWLSKQIKLENYQEINSKCTRLNKWKLLKNTDSLSVVFVSGYLGNPASAFGHSFIKINKSSNSDDNLFDTSISYGALLPSDYTMPSYIYNGMTGGYVAAYSDKYYYNQDVTYTNQEYRDMWEYRLNLSESKKKLFLLHAWELMGKKFQYFFLNRNCGYKVSELLELIIEEDLRGSSMVWFAPIETFYKLKALNEKDNKLIKEVIYIPSKEQQLYAHYDGLSHKEQKIVKEMIEENLTKIPKKFKDAKKYEKSNALDFALAYHKYSTPKASNRQLLFSRMKYPVRTKKIKTPKEKVNITAYVPPTFLALSSDFKNSLSLHWSPFALEEVAYNGLDGDELVVFDTKITLEKEKIKVEKFDLIRIQKLRTEEIPFKEENPFSWNLNIGMEDRTERDYFAEAGMGLAWGLNDNMKLYSMLDVSIHSNDGHYRVKPKIGLFNNFDKLRLGASFGYEKNIEDGQVEKVIDFKGQFKLDGDIAIFSEYSLNQEERFEFGVKYFY